MGWSSPNRAWKGNSTFVYHSDDGGATWCSWREPGLTGALPSYVGKKIVRLAPYRGHVALFSGKYWTRFDGEKWAEREASGVAKCWHVVSCGEEIYVSDNTGPCRFYDGSAWHDFSVSGRTGKQGKIGVCGNDTLVFVETDESRKKLLCWRKKKGGVWQGPEELLSEEKEIVKIVVQRYAPKGFMPVVYRCASGAVLTFKHRMYKWPDTMPWTFMAFEPWIKMLVVPAGAQTVSTPSVAK